MFTKLFNKIFGKVSEKLPESLKKIIPEVLPAHNPMDWRETKTRKEWKTYKYCPQCKGEINHNDYMSDICHRCGHFNTSTFRLWSYRKIWNGSSWVFQYKFNNSETGYDIRETEYARKSFGEI